MRHEGLSLTLDIYNITMDTLDSTFYSSEPGCYIHATRVTAHFSGQVYMYKISTLTFVQRHVFDSGTSYNNEHKDNLLGKPRKAINDISTILSFNMSQLPSMDYEIARDIKILGGQIDIVQHYHLYSKPYCPY